MTDFGDVNVRDPATIQEAKLPFTRGLRPCVRRDLAITKQLVKNQTVWHVKDPVKLNYFSFSVEEFSIIQLLDGTRTPRQVLAAFANQFPTKHLADEELVAFLLSLQRNDLLMQASNRTPAPRPLWWSQLHPARLLAIRLPGIDIDPFLGWLYRYASWMFCGPMLAACLSMVGVAALLLLANWEGMRSQLPDIDRFLSLGNLYWLGLALCVSRILHELGHALMCKHFGGECHDAGVLLLVFTPCLYCDVTDSWMASDRWCRIAISAAGILVDVFLASIAIILWTFASSGFVRSFLLNIVLVCGVSTLLVNGNPLLRYDGYYILSDLIDAPNLWQRSRASTKQWFARWVLGASPDNKVEERWSWTMYGLASICYRVFVLVAITLLLYRLLSPLGLRFIVDVLVVSTLLAICLRQIVSMIQFIANRYASVNGSNRMPGSMNTRSFRWPNVLVTVGFLATLIYMVTFVKLDSAVSALAMLKYADAQTVYVAKPGTLVHAATPGTFVLPGETIAELASPELELELAQLEGQLRRQETRLANIDAIQFDDVGTSTRLPAAHELRDDLKKQVDQKRKEFETLTITASRPGVLMHPSRVAQEKSEVGELLAWCGSPLDPNNGGCLLERGTVLGLVGDPEKAEVVAVVDDAQVGRIEEGAVVDVLFRDGTTRLVRGTVIQISSRDLDALPDEFVFDNAVVASQDIRGIARPRSSSYQARIAINWQGQDNTPHPRHLVQGMRLRVKIHTAPESFYKRARRWVKQNFLL